jgi:hypothetical protein
MHSYIHIHTYKQANRHAVPLKWTVTVTVTDRNKFAVVVTVTVSWTVTVTVTKYSLYQNADVQVCMFSYTYNMYTDIHTYTDTTAMHINANDLHTHLCVYMYKDSNLDKK